jgi:hypothetical protein
MHQLEREAQNDPFLMDALEGYADAGKDQQGNLAGIRGRLQQRTETKVKRLLPWKTISVAASIVVVLGIGTLWLTKNDTVAVQEGKTAYLQKEPARPPSLPDTTAVGNIAPQASTQAAEAEIAKRQRYSSAKRKRYSGKTIYPDNYGQNPGEVADKTIIRQGDSTSMEERVAVGFFGSPQKKEQQPETSQVVAIAPDTLHRILAGRVPGARVDDRLKSNSAKNLSGIVIDGRDVLPGVLVRVNGTNIGAITDAQGKFTVPVVPDKSVLSLGYAGYQQKQVKVSDQDSLVIAMEPSKGALNEVVVTGYGTAKKQKVKPYPISGQKQFDEYLQQNATSPDGKTGAVKLSFVVNTDGSLSDFKIRKGLSEEANNKAIGLIKDGPEWRSGNSGKPEKVEVTINFTAKP